MRFSLLLSILFFIPSLSIAQYCPPLSGKVGDAKLFHVTVGYGITKLYGDVSANSALGSAGTITFDYQIKKGLFVGIESQFGSLRTEVSESADSKQSHNDYLAGGVRVSFHPFAFFSKNNYSRSYSDLLLESLYVGVGSLYVINNNDYIFRNVSDYSTYGVIEGYSNSGEPIFKDRTRTLILPSLNFGTVLPLNNQNMNRSLSLVLMGQLNFGQNDFLDGYTPYDSTGKLIEGANDVYNFYSLGFRYSF